MSKTSDANLVTPGKRSHRSKVADVVTSGKASPTSDIVDMLTTANVSHTSMTFERNDAQVSKGLGGLERALAASGLVSDDTDDPDSAEAIVNEQLTSWSNGSVAAAVERGSPAVTFDEQLDGLNAGLARPAGVLQWHGNKKVERPGHSDEFVEEEISRALLPDQERRAAPLEARAVPMEEEIAAWEVEDEMPASARLPVEEKIFTSPLTVSTDRMLKNVDSLCEAFQRIEQQLDGMELLCDELMGAH